MRLSTIALLCTLGLSAAAGAQRAAPEAAVARALISDSLMLMRANEIDMAVGYATAALDIARHSGNESLSRDVEGLLHAYRTLGLAQTAQAAQAHGHMKAARRLSAIACKMAHRTPERMAPLVEDIKARYCVSA